MDFLEPIGRVSYLHRKLEGNIKMRFKLQLFYFVYLFLKNYE